MEPTSSSAALLLFAAVGFLGVAASTAKIHYGDFDSYYDEHCGGVVPRQHKIASESASSYAVLLQFYGGFFSADGGRRRGAESGHDLKRAVSFTPMAMHGTESKDVISLHGALEFADPNVSAIFGKSKNRRLREFHVRGPRIPVRRGTVKFRLNGYWSQSSGKLCMVGSGVFFNRSFHAVFKLNYPMKSSINSSFVSGVLESLDGGDGAGGADHFGLSLSSGSVDYEYSLIEKKGGSGSFDKFDDGGGDNLSSEKLGQGLCLALKWNLAFDLEYRSVCHGGKCNPLGTDVGFLPKAMSFTTIRCLEEGKTQLLLKFQNVTNVYYGYYNFDPSTTLIGEGEWDSKANRWCAVACRILNLSMSLTDAFAGNCLIKLCWRFPVTFSVINRYPVVGWMWSNETVKDSGYFDKIKFWSHNDALPGVKYENGVKGARKPCESKTGKHKGKTYPKSYSSIMRFDMSIKFTKGQIAFGYSSPLFVGDKRFNLPFHPYIDSYMLKVNRTENAVQLDSTHGPLQNISYTIRFTPPDTFELAVPVKRDNLSQFRQPELPHAEPAWAWVPSSVTPSSQGPKQAQAFDPSLSVPVRRDDLSKFRQSELPLAEPALALTPPSSQAPIQAPAFDPSLCAPEIVMYKNWLQDYALKMMVHLPIYDTRNEGSQHAPRYRSTVFIDGKSFTSPNTFSRKREAEQNVAKIALDLCSLKMEDEGSPLIPEV
ncbi:LOW QUALITY PROTEIN: uncharacterized protein LOC120288336 [Eucalyptus grandis]|uniref:LOW QUALITY PROTEIN: uncharacterized protein LOC120288336 n=1 Tax=Eucalyptus grandis TaxID=71139 RepID=UPI00192EA362|nr:LOW QUALITY PROTEIN: uncharacterized protein LOC120288336 [Eucalyptus grandis]